MDISLTYNLPGKSITLCINFFKLSKLELLSWSVIGSRLKEIIFAVNRGHKSPRRRSSPAKRFTIDLMVNPQYVKTRIISTEIVIYL